MRACLRGGNSGEPRIEVWMGGRDSDDILLFHPHTWHGWINGDKPFEFLGFDMQEKK